MIEVREKPLVLVIEDIADNRIALQAVLKDKYTIIETNNGITGLDMVMDRNPDIVLLDIHLPGMDGNEVVRKMKSDSRIAHIPVVAVTASAMKGDREAMFDSGCDDYIIKPVDPEKLHTTISHWLNLNS